MESKEKKMYARQYMLKGWDQELIKNSTVFMIGAGALGCEIAKNLALVGIGKIIIVDVDTIETSNLSRQMLFRPGDEGRGKAEVAAERLKGMNPFMTVEHYNKLLQEIPMKVYEEADIVIGGLDNIKARLDLNKICLTLKKPLIDSGTLGFEGHVQIVTQGIEGFDDTPCLRCLMPVPPTDEKLVAACTPKGVPRKREHCALKAEYDYGKEFGKRPDFDNDKDLEYLARKANEYVETYKFYPEFKPEEMENVIGNKMPAIQTTTAIISAIQSHEILKILHKLKGKDIGPVMNPPYINYNGVYGLFEQIDVGRWEECPACGSGQDTRKIEIDPEATIRIIFDALSKDGFDFDIEKTMVSIERNKQVIWNPHVERLKDESRKISDVIEDHEILIFSQAKIEPIRMLIDFVK
ncbi:MAG: ThiF family adenylyltransferase [Candidatus Helarchaeota archaeon]